MDDIDEQVRKDEVNNLQDITGAKPLISNEDNKRSDLSNQNTPSNEGDEGQFIVTGKAIGANTDYLSAQSFVYKENEKIFLYVIAGSGDDVFSQIKRVGLDCRDNILNQNEEIPKIILAAGEFIKNELKSLDKLQIVITVVKNNILYCLLVGGGFVYLNRHGRMIEVSKNITFGKLISGLIQSGDKVLVLNSQVIDSNLEDENRLPWDLVFLQDLIDTPPDYLEEELEAYLQRFSLKSPVAIAALAIPAEEVPEEVSEPQITAPLLHEPHPQPRAPFLPILLIRSFVSGLIDSRRFKFFLIVALILLVLLAVFGVSRLQKNSQKNSQIQVLLNSSKADLSRAVSIKDTDQDGARAALIKAKQELQQAQKLDPKNNQVLDLQKQINTQSGVILKEYDVGAFPVFLDLSLIKDGFSTQKMSFSLGKISFLDLKQKTLVVLNTADKNPKILSGQLQLGDAQFASLNGDQIFVYSKDKGVVRVDIGNGKADIVVKPDSEWQRISDIFGFANNIYLLDEFKNQIWKYIATESGFSQRNNYLKDDVTADFAGVKKMEIDGSIWVLKSNNTVLKFIQGGQDFFQFQGFEVPINNIKSFYVSDDTDNMYFLDNDNSRVVITKKNGQYLGQYSGDKFKTADDLAIDEAGKKMYLLENGKIYLVTMN